MIGTVWEGPMLELSHVHRWFGATHAVNDVSFEIPRGSVFGYIGPNGAGKTTSMRILATLELPTSGDAWVAGYSAIDDPDRVRVLLGFMPDTIGVYSDTNCIEYLDFFARAYGLIGRDRTKRLRWVLEFTGLWPLARKQMRGLSKGMRQRLCLGRAMLHDPPVLILDEPAAGLDPRARIDLRQMIKTLASEGKSILISSHILTELAEMCDHIGIIEQGRLLATGRVDDIRKRFELTKEVLIKTLKPVALDQMLVGIDIIDQVSQHNGAWRVTMHGGESAQARIMHHLWSNGCEVIEFSPQEKSLEDVFLQITQGQIQ